MKKKRLNGLPNSLEQRYFSTLFYFQKGYMAEWIWNTAIKHNITEIEIDILNEKVTPKQLEITPITAQLKNLRTTITKTLLVNRFPENFIIDARFKIYIPQKDSRWFTCIPTMTDKEGKEYIGRTYWEQATEGDFQFVD